MLRILMSFSEFAHYEISDTFYLVYEWTDKDFQMKRSEEVRVSNIQVGF